jgi:succinyl-CoA synthetase beta subunit
MNIHEHQAKELLRQFGAPVPRGQVAFTPEEAVRAAESLGGPVFVVKSQIHAGGRGKGTFEGLGPDAKGGVRVVKTVEDVRKNAEEMLGRTLVTIQTGPKGKQVNRLYIEEGADIARELYLSLLVDRETSKVAVVASTEGGMDIEAVAHDTPEKIITIQIDPATGVMPHHGRSLAAALGLEGDTAKQAARVLGQLYTRFIAKDMAMLEVNPLLVDGSGRVIVLDAKIGFDPNASTATRTCASCATSPRRTTRRSRPRSTTSATSRSTARSAAWSTAPAWPWPPWTSSSSTGPSPPTSSTWAAAPQRRR